MHMDTTHKRQPIDNCPFSLMYSLFIVLWITFHTYVTHSTASAIWTRSSLTHMPLEAVQITLFTKYCCAYQANYNNTSTNTTHHTHTQLLQGLVITMFLNIFLALLSSCGVFVWVTMICLCLFCDSRRLLRGAFLLRQIKDVATRDGGGERGVDYVCLWHKLREGWVSEKATCFWSSVIVLCYRTLKCYAAFPFTENKMLHFLAG